jgi:hypothetical protein
LSVPIAQSTAPSVGAEHGAPPATQPPSPPSIRHFYAWLLSVALALAALSLLFPSTPSYDPWAWLVWGREITHFALHTPGGPTWKPLPVIFTTLLSPFGSAQPNLWLAVARAGAFIACVMAFVLASRIVWWLREPVAGEGRIAAFAPPALAGLIAMASLALTGGFLSASTLGYSEGLMVAAILIAVQRHLDGHRHQAFILGFVAALDRPEVWLFWGPYGLWLMWKDPSSRVLVVSLAILTLLLWFVPQKLGGGSFTSGVSRAQHPRKNSAAFAGCPFCEELKGHAWPQVLLRLKVPAVLALIAALAALWRSLRTRGGWIVSGNRERALLLIAASAIFGYAWWILVGLETQAGFSGNDRYLVLGSAFITVAGAAGFGWAVLVLARWARRHIRAMRSRGGLLGATSLATVLCAAVFVFSPNFIGSNYINISETHGSLLYQGHLRQDLAALIAADGGAKHVLACGSVMTEGFQVPMVAWYLNVRTLDVLAPPAVNPTTGVAVGANGQPSKVWPNTIFQDRDTRSAPWLPLPPTIIAWEHDGAHYRSVYTKTFRFFQDCSSHGASS